MAKLSTARSIRTYGPRASRNRWEYVNAGIYLFAVAILIAGIAAHHSSAGLLLILIALFLIAAVNAHDLVAHFAGIDFCPSLLRLDPQLLFVELAVPFFLALGSLLIMVAFVFFLIQKERGFSWRLEKHGLNLLIAGPVFWLLGSVHNLCQVYENSGGQFQILQKSVQIPFLTGSLLFLAGGFFGRHEIFGHVPRGFILVSKSWVWMSLLGSLLFFVGGLMNVVKVFRMQQIGGSNLEKLRGGALERLNDEREGRVPLILEGSRRRRSPEGNPPGIDISSGGDGAASTPYKDVLVSGSGNGKP